VGVVLGTLGRQGNEQVLEVLFYSLVFIILNGRVLEY
jgi:hypothetical protein